MSKRIKFRERVQLTQDNSGSAWHINASFSQVKEVLVEYAFARVLAMLGVGPRLKRDIGFDLVCYRDCIEFFMEKCEPIQVHTATNKWSEADSRRLKYCVRVIHCHQLIHRDIKPANIVWSPSVGDYVLCDFGISCSVPEEVGFKSKTDSSGTEEYMSKQMKQLKGEGFVDLYYNDMHALEVSLYELVNMKRSERLYPPTSGSGEPTPRIMLLKSLSKLLKGAQLEDGEATNSPPLSAPELKLAETGAHLLEPNIEFLLNSVEVSFELQRFLQECDQNNEHVSIISKRVASVMAKPSFVKQRYEEIESIRSYLFPAQLRGARKGELARLSNSLFLTPNEQVRYWRLLAEELGSVDAILRDPEEKLMMEFKRQKAVPGFEDLQSRVEVLHSLKSGRSILELG